MSQGKRYLLEELAQKNQLICDLVDQVERSRDQLIKTNRAIEEQDKHLTERQRKLVDEALANQAGPG